MVSGGLTHDFWMPVVGNTATLSVRIHRCSSHTLHLWGSSFYPRDLGIWLFPHSKFQILGSTLFVAAQIVGQNPCHSVHCLSTQIASECAGYDDGFTGAQGTVRFTVFEIWQWLFVSVHSVPASLQERSKMERDNITNSFLLSLIAFCSPWFKPVKRYLMIFCFCKF